MASDLIERVARALWEAMPPADYDEVPWEHITRRPRYAGVYELQQQAARAAILATLEGMREPSDAVIKAGEMADGLVFRDSENAPAEHHWSNMLDAIRAEVERVPPPNE